MPSGIFRNSVRDIAKASTTNGPVSEIPVSDSIEFSEFLLELSRRWKVSQEAARIRLETLGLLRISSEPMLETNTISLGWGHKMCRKNTDVVFDPSPPDK